MINVDELPGFAAAGEAKFPAYADHMRRLYAQSGAVVRAAYEAGVPIYVGTDAGGGIAHGVIADEVLVLHAGGNARRGGAGRGLVGGPGVARAARASSRARRPTSWSTTPTRAPTSRCCSARGGRAAGPRRRLGRAPSSSDRGDPG